MLYSEFVVYFDLNNHLEKFDTVITGHPVYLNYHID